MFNPATGTVYKVEKYNLRTYLFYHLALYNYSFVKTKENELAEVPHEKVAGMLLYAQTEEEGKFNNEYQIMGNRICVRTLDLSGDFQSIKKQLDEIAEKYLLVKAA